MPFRLLTYRIKKNYFKKKRQTANEVYRFYVLLKFLT